MTKNPLIEKIDAALLILRDANDGITKNELFHKLKDQKIDVHHTELTALIDKLVRDGYIEAKWISRSVETLEGFLITYDGLIFVYSGGYYAIEWMKDRDWDMARQSDKKLKEAQEKQIEMLGVQLKNAEEQNKIQTGMRILTRWIAAGTIIAAIYYTLEVIDYAYHYFHPLQTHV